MTKRTVLSVLQGTYDKDKFVSQLKEKGIDTVPVSYTHLDVYKRQLFSSVVIFDVFLIVFLPFVVV